MPVGYLPQRLDVLDDTATVLVNVARRAPDVPDQDVRAQLARLLFRGRRAEQVAGTLSGGERFRAALASILLARAPARPRRDGARAEVGVIGSTVGAPPRRLDTRGEG